MKKLISLQQYITIVRQITQDQAAQELGISRPYLNMVIMGKRPAGRPLCVKLAKWSSGRIDLEPLMMIPN
jgi:hypothetical protein